MYISWGEKEFLLFRYLLKNPQIDLKQVEKDLPLSHMTIRAAIENINDFLKKNGKKEIKKIKGQLYFPIESLENFSTNCYFFSTNIERFDYLLMKFLFEKEVVLSKELEILKVSRTTLDSIIDKINEFIKNFNLKVDSQPWSGFTLQGELKNKIVLAIEFIGSLFIFKELNPDFYRIFNIESSNIIYRELHKVISKEDKKLAETLTSEIFKSFNYKENIYFYNLTVAFILALKIYKDQLKDNLNLDELCTKFKPCDYKSDCDKLLNILEQIPDLKFMKEYIRILLRFLLKNNDNIVFFGEQSTKCIHELRELFKINITEESLKKFKQWFYIASYKNKFNLKIYNLKVEDFPINYKKVLEKIKPTIQKYFENIFDEDILVLIFELRNIFLNSKSVGKQILLIDSTNVLSIFGGLIKNRLEVSYNIKTIDSKSIFSINNWKELEQNYDIVFFLNSYALNVFKANQHDISIPYHVIAGGNFIKDPYFFTNYDIELKNENI